MTKYDFLRDLNSEVSPKKKTERFIVSDATFFA